MTRTATISFSLIGLETWQGGAVVGPDVAFLQDTDVYWPSAVRVGEETLIYATVENAAGIRSLHLWQSGSSSQRFDYVGPVLEAVGDEGQVGMSHVAYDRDAADAPFKMWYSTRYSARATAIAYATSYDGKAWDRKGMVYSPTLPSEAAGLTVDFVCRDKSGDWRLFYSGLESVDCIRAMAATSRKPSGPFVSPRVIMAPDAAEYAGGAEVTNDDLSLTLTGTPMPAPGFPYVLTDGTQSGSGLVFIERVAGNIAYLRNPAGLTAEGYRLLSVHARKVSPAIIAKAVPAVVAISPDLAQFRASPLSMSSLWKRGTDGSTLSQTTRCSALPLQ